MASSWFEAQKNDANVKAAGGAITAEQALFIYDRYNGDDNLAPETDPNIRHWSWDMLVLLNQIENEMIAQQQRVAERNFTPFDAQVQAGQGDVNAMQDPNLPSYNPNNMNLQGVPGAGFYGGE